MTEKLKVFKTVIFFERPWVQPSMEQRMQMEIYLPIEAIAYISNKEMGNPRGGYEVHFRKSFLTEIPVPVKSISPVYLSQEQLELIK